MSKSRSTALRTLASIRGRFDGVFAEKEKFENMYQLARDALASNTKEQQAAASRAGAAERVAAREGRKVVAALQKSLSDALAKCEEESINAAEQDLLARAASDTLEKVRAAMKDLEEKEAAGGERARLAEYELKLSERREQRAKESLVRASEERGSVPRPRTSEEWEALGMDAERKARAREVEYIKGFLESRTFRAADLCTALHLSGWLDELWGEREMNKIYFEELRCVMA
eukprot:5102443-Pleurochrysis_carterae.AAC.1